MSKNVNEVARDIADRRAGFSLNYGMDAVEAVIDSYFIVTNLKDIPISEQERMETSFWDAMCSQAAGE